MKLDFSPREWKWATWRRWFAWYPVRIGKNDCRWLEYVECKGTIYGSIAGCFVEWQYREATP